MQEALFNDLYNNSQSGTLQPTRIFDPDNVEKKLKIADIQFAFNNS